MVWVSRLIDQDANIFAGARLVATSERNLFASGLLPTRTPADVYRALALRREAATVARERIGDFESVSRRGGAADRPTTEAILTVPLTSRQREIDAGDRRARPPRAAGGAALHPRRRRARLLDGRAHLPIR